jgi:hypothetical protein
VVGSILEIVGYPVKSARIEKPDLKYFLSIWKYGRTFCVVRSID